MTLRLRRLGPEEDYLILAEFYWLFFFCLLLPWLSTSYMRRLMKSRVLNNVSLAVASSHSSWSSSPNLNGITIFITLPLQWYRALISLAIKKLITSTTRDYYVRHFHIASLIDVSCFSLEHSLRTRKTYKNSPIKLLDVSLVRDQRLSYPLRN